MKLSVWQACAGVLVLCALLWGAVPTPAVAGEVVGKVGDAECVFTVRQHAADQAEYRVLDIRVRPRRLTVPPSGDTPPVSADYVDIYRGDAWLATLRVYASGTVSAQPFAGRQWYRVASHGVATEARGARLSLVSPEGEVINVYDADAVSDVQVREREGSLYFTWTEENLQPPAESGSGTSADPHHSRRQGSAVLGAQRIRTEVRDTAGLTFFDWRELRRVRAVYVSGDELDNILMLLRFRTADGGNLELVDFGRAMRAWLEAARGRPLLLTYGACDFDLSAESGDVDAGLFEAVPLPE